MASEEEDSSISITLNGTPVSELTINDIKKELDKRGLSKAGSRTQIAERLKAQLLLEKLQQDAAQSSGDELSEGKVPNIALQQDEKGGQNEFVRQYLQQQQRNLEIQMEVKRQVEEERKRKSTDESSADDAKVKKHEAKEPANPDVTSPKKFKDSSNNAPVKEATKMPRPARKSSRNASKGNENGQDQDIIKNRSRSPTPEGDKIRERTRSGSSSSSRSASPDKAARGRRGRPARGRPQITAPKRRSNRTRKDSSSSASSPEEVIPKKKNRRSTNSTSSRSRSRSPHIVASGTRRTSGRSSNASSKSITEENKEELKEESGRESLQKGNDLSKTDNNGTAVEDESMQNIDHVTQKQDSTPVEKTNIEKANSSASSDVKDNDIQLNPEEKKLGSRLSRWKSKSKSVNEDERSVKLAEPNDSGDVRTVIESLPPKEENMDREEDEVQQTSSESRTVVRSRRNSDSPNQRARSMSRSGSSRSRSRSSSSGSTTDTGAADQKPSSQVGSRKVISSPRGEAATEKKSTDISKVQINSRKDPESPPDEEKPVKASTEDQNNTVGHNPASKDEKEDRSAEHQIGKSTVTEADKEGNDNQGMSEQDTSKKEKGVKKRKWGSKTSKAAKTIKKTTSMEISSESLKGLIGDVKLTENLTESVFDMETEVVNTLDYEPEEDRRDIKMKRTILQDLPKEKDAESTDNAETDARTVEQREDPLSPVKELSSPPPSPPKETEKKIIKISTAPPKEGSKKSKEAKKIKKKKDEIEKEKGSEPVKNAPKENKERVIATTRPPKTLLPVVDEPLPVGKGSQSPARNPVDRVIRIACLVRPFTVNQLKELLRRNGELDDEYFWISDIKSHCLAAFKKVEDAVTARSSLHGTKWPQSNPKILVVDFATIEDVEHRKAEAAGISLPVKKQEEPKKLIEKKDDDERRRAREQREKEREEREKEAREKRDSDRQRRRETEKKNPVREWDRDKIQQMSRSRSRSKEEARPTRRSRSHSHERERQKRREQSREKKEEEKRKEKKQKEAKAEEEPPAKLLDDLFRKTKATPCIYWLPLTEEQSLQRQIKLQQSEKERQKRIAARKEKEKDEEKEREALRQKREKELREREREREKERARSRDRDRNRGKQERAKSSSSRSRSRSRKRR